MSITKFELNESDTTDVELGLIDYRKVDATTEQDIATHMQQDEAEAIRDAASFARNVRVRLGMSQTELSNHIHVSTETIRNWEQGKRTPTGPAKALLKILYKQPKAALKALK